jgi:hypothetical protein
MQCLMFISKSGFHICTLTSVVYTPIEDADVQAIMTETDLPIAAHIPAALRRRKIEPAPRLLHAV